MLTKIITASTKATINFKIVMATRKIKLNRVDMGIQNKLKNHHITQSFHVLDDEQNDKSPIHTATERDEQIKDQILKMQKAKDQVGKQKNRQTAVIKKHKNSHTQIVDQTQNAKPPSLIETNQKLQKALTSLGKALDPIDPKQIKNLGTINAIISENKQIENAVALMKSLNLKDFSVLIHRLLVNSSGYNGIVQRFFWKEIEEDFLRRFEVTTQPDKIRSYSKIIYSLSKSKVHRNNSNETTSSSISTNLQSFQTKFALLLPSSTNQSFTSIVTSLSRMGPLSEEFSYIIEKLYYIKRQLIKPRERVQINYALTRNGRLVDSKLYQCIDSLNLKQIVIMLRCYQNSRQLDKLKPENSKHKNLLSFVEPHIIARKAEMNVIDIGQICNIYFEAMAADSYRISPELENALTIMYKVLSKNINQVSFEKIWKNLPVIVNRGYLQIEFVEEIMKTLRIMRKKDLFPHRIWIPLKNSFQGFQNLEIRAKLDQIK